MDTPYTKLSPFQYRGPSSSDDYNLRIQNNYRDLVALINQSRVLRDAVQQGFGQLIMDQDFITRALSDLDSRVQSLEDNSSQLTSTLHAPDDSESDRFTSTAFEITSSARLTRENQYGLVLLPRIDSASVSKLSFTDTEGAVQIPASFEIRAQGDDTTADSGSAIIKTSDPMQAVAKVLGRVWERDVIVGSPNVNGAVMNVYIKVPTDLFTTANSNVLVLNPFPVLSTDLLEVAVTDTANVFLQDTDDYVPLNSGASYASNSAAVGWLPPGGWSGDEILASPPKAFYFNPQLITGIRLRIRQSNAYQHGSQYIYPYGFSLIDLRYEKFLSTGKTMVMVTAPSGSSISSIDDVQPHIYNVSESEVPDVFSYRVIWETSFDSGIYTLTPVSLSTRVWIEVTLNTTVNNGSPALSGLSVSYS